MGTTPNLGLPYPEGTDLVIQGDDAIEALATALDGGMGDTVVAVIGRSDADAALGTSPAIVHFPGPMLRMDGFTYDAGTLTYGPFSARTVMVAVEVTTSVEGTNTVTTSVDLRSNGVGFTGSYDRTTRTDGGTIRRDYTHRITTPVRLNAGDTLDVIASGSVGGTIDVTSLRIYPVGPHA